MTSKGDTVSHSPALNNPDVSSRVGAVGGGTDPGQALLLLTWGRWQRSVEDVASQLRPGT